MGNILSYSLSMREIERIVNEKSNPEMAERLGTMTRGVVVNFRLEAKMGDVNDKIIPLFKKAISYCKELYSKTFNIKYLYKVNDIRRRIGTIVEFST